MNRIFVGSFLFVLLFLGLAPLSASAMSQDNVYFVMDSVEYGSGQETLIVTGDFVNTSNRDVTAIKDAYIEVVDTQGLIASETIEVSKEKFVRLPIGSAYSWTFVMNSPAQGRSLKDVKISSSVYYNSGDAVELPSGQKVYYNGYPISFDIKPTVINGRIMVPARAVFEKMGCSVAWNESSRSLDVTRTGDRIIIFIDNQVMTANGQAMKLDTPATVIEGRTLVPLRAISSALGAGVTYGTTNQMAVVYE